MACLEGVASCLVGFRFVFARWTTTHPLLAEADQLDSLAFLRQDRMGFVWMLRRPFGLVIPIKPFAAIGDHFFFFGFRGLAVLAAALKSAALGRLSSPRRAMRSSLPDSIRLRLALMLA